MGAWLLFIAMAGGAGFSLYMALLAWGAGDNSSWLFLAMGVLLLIPTVAHLFRAGYRKCDTSPRPTRFVPHWIIMSVAITLGLCMLVSVLLALLH